MRDPLVLGATRQYHDLLGAYMASTRAALDACGDRIDCGVLRPCFVAGGTYASVLDATALLNRGLLAAADQLARDPALRRKIGIPEYMDAILALDHEDGSPPPAMARFDGMIDEDGVFRVFEYNNLPGMDNADAATAAFAQTPIARELAAQYPFRTERLLDLAVEAVIAAHHEQGGTGLPVVAVPVPAGSRPLPRPSWLAAIEARGGEVVSVPFEELRHEGGRLVTGSGLAVDMVAPRWGDLLPLLESKLPLFDAIKARSVRMVNGFSRSVLAAFKNTFELLSDPQYASLFDAPVAAVLAKHVPWTRVLRNGPVTYGGRRVDLLPFVAESRARMVLKPSGGTQGTGVILGWRTTDAEWRATLKRVLRKGYVVQERVLASTELYPARAGDGLLLENATTTFEPFVWNGRRAAGALARVSTTDAHNVVDGCSVPPIWILEPRA